MRDPGLHEAIEAVGGVTELARRLRIAQPSVSDWDRVPADRVLAVEAATGIQRVRLRPDLYADESPVCVVDPIDAERAQEYALLATLLANAPSSALLKRLARLRGEDSALGAAHQALGEAAMRANTNAVEREYFNLFIGVGRGEILPYASYYLTGFLHERPLARLRSDLHKLGIVRAEGNCEPEDHAAILCEIMSGIAEGRFPAPPSAHLELFEKHIAPWMGRLFADMERAEHASFYRAVGSLGRVFLEIEAEAFTLAD